MLGLVQSWFAPTANPIGVDFGSDSLRLAQVESVDGEFKLVAAASADVPAHIRQDPTARLGFFADTVKDLLAHGNFRGRKAILSLPASSMFIQHLRMAKMDEEDLKKALPWEARGKIPIDPSHALLRHVVAGEIYLDQEPKNEVILMAAARELVNQLLASAARAKLDVVGMNVEPQALVDCFAHIYRRKSDSAVASCFIDVGCTASRAIIARGSQMLFARVIPVGGDHFNRAVASSLKISFEEAKVLRIKLCNIQPSVEEAKAKPGNAEPATLEQAFPLLGAGMQAGQRQAGGATAVAEAPSAVAQRIAAAPATAAPRGEPISDELLDKQKRVEQAVREPLAKLIEELDLCRRYHESTFPNLPVNRLVFIGGEARHRGLCQQIARQLSLAAQVGDPLVRMGRTSDVGVESGIDRRQPQPAWAVALGLSMGPVGAEAAVTGSPQAAAPAKGK